MGVFLVEFLSFRNTILIIMWILRSPRGWAAMSGPKSTPSSLWVNLQPMKYYTEAFCSNGGHSMVQTTNRILQGNEDIVCNNQDTPSLPLTPNTGARGGGSITIGICWLYCNYCMPPTPSYRFLDIYLFIMSSNFL